MSDHIKGLLITVLGVLILSPDSLLIRLANVDHWTLLVYRGLLMAIGMSALSSLFDKTPLKQQYLKIGKTGALATLFFTVSTIGFVSAVTYTSIAHTLVIVAISPLFAALYGWVLLGEPLRKTTLFAIVCVALGMVLVVGKQQQGTSWLGDLCALISAACIAATFVLTQRNKQINMVPAIAASGLLTTLIVFPFASFAVLDAQTNAVLLLMGLLVTVAFALITIGPRYISATEVSLIMPLETVGGIALAWVFLNEVPGNRSILGAVIILLSLMVHGIISARKKR